jgi:hypothetical protein
MEFQMRKEFEFNVKDHKIKVPVAFFTVEIDAYLVFDNTKQHIFSSHKRLSLTEQRTA